MIESTDKADFSFFFSRNKPRIYGPEGESSALPTSELVFFLSLIIRFIFRSFLFKMKTLFFCCFFSALVDTSRVLSFLEYVCFLARGLPDFGSVVRT